MAEKTFQLMTRKGPQPGKVYPLIAEKIVVGRDPMSDIPFNDPEVSRQHAQFVRTESGYTLEDLGSTNGTFIDGEQLAPGETHALHNGQIVSMGSGVTLLYEVSGAAVEPVAAEEPPAPETADQPQAADVFAPADAPRQDSGETAVPSPQRQPAAQTPLVMPGNDSRNRKRRRNVILAVVSLLLLCCCCLVLLYTGYFYWGDPLYEYLLTLLR